MVRKEKSLPVLHNNDCIWKTGRGGIIINEDVVYDCTAVFIIIDGLYLPTAAYLSPANLQLLG